MTSATNPPPVRLDDALAAKAADLARNIKDGYTDGYEQTLADQLIGTLTPDQRRWALADLVGDKMRELVAIDCVLDEDSDETYRVLDDMARTFVDLINRQGGQGAALRELVTSHIVNGAETHNMVLDLMKAQESQTS